MFIWLERDGNDVTDLTNITRTTDFVDISLLKGQMAENCIGTLQTAISYLTPESKSEAFCMRFSDAKQHAKLALAKKVNFTDRMVILFESFEIIMGWEYFWVPSSRNTVAILGNLTQLAQQHPKASFNVS